MKSFKKLIFFLFFFIFFIGCTAKKDIIKEAPAASITPEGNGTITGKTIFLDQYNFLESTYVYLYKKIEDFPHKPLAVSSPSDKEGNYKIEAVSGQYFIAAIKRKSGLTTGPIENNDYFAFFGGNPVNILYNKEIRINLNLSKKIIPSLKRIPAEDKEKSGIKGKILYEDGVLENAYAFVYQTTDYNLKGPVYNLSSITGKDGTFSIDLPEGTYWLLAKKKEGKNIIPKKEATPPKVNDEDVLVRFKYIENFAGPLESGDYFSFYDENPIKVEKGFYSNVLLNCIQKIGDEKKGYTKLTDMRLEGIIIDKNGEPVENMFAFAHQGVQTSLDMPKPKFISTRTKKDGKFILNFTEEGVYYIGAKRVLGRVPQFGDLYGYYVSPDKDNAVILRKGAVVDGIVIKVSPIE